MDLKPAYTLLGQDIFLQDWHLQNIKANIKKSQPNCSFERVKFKQNDLKSILDQANTFSLLSHHQAFIIDVESSLSDNDLKNLLEYLKNPAEFSSLIFMCQKLDKRKKEYKALNKHSQVFACEAVKNQDMPKWLNDLSLAFGLKWTAHSRSLCLSMVGNDLSFLNQSMNKLSLFMHPRTEVTDDDVMQVMQDVSGHNIFGFIELVLQKNISQSLIYLHKVIRQGDHPMVILSLLSRHFRILLQCQSKAGASNQDLARSIGVPPFAVSKYVQQARSLSKNKLMNIFYALADLDKQFKSSSLNMHHSLEQFILKHA